MSTLPKFFLLLNQQSLDDFFENWTQKAQKSWESEDLNERFTFQMPRDSEHFPVFLGYELKEHFSGMALYDFELYSLEEILSKEDLHKLATLYDR